MSFIYWIYFDKNKEPERIVVDSYLEFQTILARLIERTGEMPEWIIRGYR